MPLWGFADTHAHLMAMLPDFLHDLRNVNVGLSANDYVQMWSKCSARARSGAPVPGSAPAASPTG